MNYSGLVETIPGRSQENGKNGEKVLFLGLIPGKNYGWGVCSEYLIKELSQKAEIHVLTEKDVSAENRHVPGKLFQALTGVDFFPLFEGLKGTVNVGYTFFENELTDLSLENSKKFDLVLGGSDWCRDRMLEKGIDNCGVLIQGIDPNIFYPIKEEKKPQTFVIFSGGKFELRKGHDLVLRAFKILRQKYQNVFLVNCWYNIWPDSVRTMAASKHLKFNYTESRSWQENMQQIYKSNGLDPTSVKTLGLVPNDMLRKLYVNTDIGVFPNRCEGGTNLVLMEYMACAKPVIASDSSGHKDIVNSQNALLLKSMQDINIVDGDNNLIARWQEPSLDELVAQMEYAYHHRQEIKTIGRRAGEDMQNFTWRESAQHLIEILSI
jgi:glycosyltransferase involved in cell wall biosynthesis